MGTVTSNISIYIPAAGETNYDASFAAGMINIDQHDHSGGPTKGVPIAASGIADGSITYPKLNANVVDATTGIDVHTGGLANQLYLKPILSNLYNLATVNGFLAKAGTAVSAYTFTSGNTNRITIASGDGTAGNPTFNAPAIPQYDGVNGTTNYDLQIGGVNQIRLSSGLFDLSKNNVAISNGRVATTGGIAPSGTANVTGFTIANGQMFLAIAGVYSGGTGQSQIAVISYGTAGENGTQNTLGGVNPTFTVVAGQVKITNNDVGSLEFQVSWIRLL